MSLVKNLAQTFGSKVFAIGLSFVTSIFLTRLLGPEGRGVFAFLTTNVMLFTLLFGFSMTKSMAYFAASGSRNEGKNLELGLGLILTFLSIVVFAFVISIFIWSDSGILNFIVPEDYQTRVVILFLIGNFAYNSVLNYITGVWQGLKLFSIYNATTIIERVISVVIFGGIWGVQLFEKEKVVESVLLTLLAIYSLDLIVRGWCFFNKASKSVGLKVKKIVEDKELVTSVLSFGSVGMLTGLLNFTNRRLDIWFIDYYEGVKALGHYALSARLSEILVTAFIPALQVLLPYLNRYSKEKGLETLSFCSRIGSITVFILFSVLIALAPLIIPTLYGSDFNESIFPFQLLCGGLYFLLIRNIFSIYNVAMNRQKHNLYGNAISVVLTIILDALLIPEYGIVGACIASIIAYFVTCAYIVWSVVSFSGMGVGYFFILKMEDLNKAMSFAKLKK